MNLFTTVGDLTILGLRNILMLCENLVHKPKFSYPHDFNVYSLYIVESTSR